MLLDLCGQVSLDDGVGSAPFHADAVSAADSFSIDGGTDERSYPAHLLAEAFAQIACRTAQAIAPLDGRRYLPARLRGLVVTAQFDRLIPESLLMATVLRLRPLPEFACRLIAPDASELAVATVVVAPAPIIESPTAPQ